MSAQDNVERLFVLNATLSARCAELGKALQFYADAANYDGEVSRNPHGGWLIHAAAIKDDKGAIARAALASLERKEG